VRSNFLRTRFSRHFEISVYFQIFAALYTIVINTFHVCFWINFTYSESQETYLFEYITFWIVYWAVDKIETWMQVGALLTANGFRNRICRKQDYKSWQRVNHRFRVIIPTYPNGHLPVWPIFGSLWPPSVSHYGQLHKKGDIRQVIINKDLGGRYVKLPWIKSIDEFF